MTHISCNSDGLLAFSVNNRLQVVDRKTNQLILKYTNESLTEGGEKGSPNLINHVFSTNKYLAAITEDKKLLVWNMIDNSLVHSLEFQKRPTCLCFCNKEDTVIVGDKSGDVYRCVLTSRQPSRDVVLSDVVPQLLLGHLSMVLDVAISRDDSFILSADRDEKIRVSFYPNSYSIHSYCLGHTDLVSTITFLTNDLLLSGSGDKSLRLWDYKDGRQVSCVNVGAGKVLTVISKVLTCLDDIAVIGEGTDSVFFYEVKDDSLVFKDSYAIGEQPYDICYCDKKLYIIVRSGIVVLEKSGDNSYVKSNISLSNISEDGLSAASLPDLKYLSDLVKPPAKKRTNEEITPESTIHYMVAPKAMRIEA